MNQKRNKGFAASALEFAQDKGFYIILAVCAVAIGISGYVLFFTGGDAGDIPLPDTPVLDITPPETPVTTVPKVDVELDQPEKPVVPSSDQPPKQPEIPKTDTTPVNKPVNVPASSGFVRPVSGELSRAYSGDDLVRDETMGDWRTHNGADYSCADGDQVFAIADGTVSKVYYDELMGNCITITHADSLESTYCGLMKNATMKEGMEVKAGDVLGGVLAGGVLCESAQQPHLHLEVTRDGKLIDPESLKLK